MKLTKLFLSLVIVTVATDCFCQGSEFSKKCKPGVKLYVQALQGLSLRAGSDLKAKVLAVVPFGGEVEVLADANAKVAITNSNIAGTWVKVKHGASTGYMFDGFLSRLKTMTLTDKARYPNELPDFLSAQFKKATETNKIPAGETLVDYTKIVFANKASYENKRYEGGVSIIVKIPTSTLTYQEVYLLARMAYPEFFNPKPCDFNPDQLDCSIDDGLTTLQLKREGEFIILSFGLGD
ncbi:hypothetical protein WSM22_13060 [Cytophagales bacterium WSM2-2]|nr:hypothetical protein WSM22_13060 [Cytophagales bacterium WSM2-2]